MPSRATPPFTDSRTHPSRRPNFASPSSRKHLNTRSLVGVVSFTREKSSSRILKVGLFSAKATEKLGRDTTVKLVPLQG